MVSKANEDFPLPLTPTIAVVLLAGISNVKSFNTGYKPPVYLK